ncbi:hypothetical protein BCR34DRAFT_488660, partial [Clohesyomyces aquaticus]
QHVRVASTFLLGLIPRDRLSVSVRRNTKAFSLLDNAVLLVIVATGTSLAPFYSFVQERAAQVAASCSLTLALLFYSCYLPKDNLYSKSFKQ